MRRIRDDAETALGGGGIVGVLEGFVKRFRDL